MWCLNACLKSSPLIGSPFIALGGGFSVPEPAYSSCVWTGKTGPQTSQGLRLFLTKFTPARLVLEVAQPLNHTRLCLPLDGVDAPLARLAGPPAMAIQTARPACRHSAMRCCCTIEMTRHPSRPSKGRHRQPFASTAVEGGRCLKFCFAWAPASAVLLADEQSWLAERTKSSSSIISAHCSLLTAHCLPTAHCPELAGGSEPYETRFCPLRCRGHLFDLCVPSVQLHYSHLKKEFRIHR
jgi:hypothetical protein